MPRQSREKWTISPAKVTPRAAGAGADPERCARRPRPGGSGHF